MRAIIPVAGFGSRLRPHTFTLPKVLLNVAGKPIIGHILDKIIADGIQEATIVVGHMGEKIREYVQTHYTIKTTFVEQHEPRGLAHALYLARESFTAEPLLIILGDTIFDVDLTKILAGTVSAIGVKHVDDPRRFGVVEAEGEMATRLIEKPEQPSSHLAIVGLYWIQKPKLLEACIAELLDRKKTTKGEYQLTDALQLMLEKGEKFRTFAVDGWYDCGKPETLLETNRHLLEKLKSSATVEGAVINPPVYVAPTARISRSIIGPYTTVGDGAVVNEAIVRNSIIGTDAQVTKALLEGSLVGNNAVVEGDFQRINIGDSSEINFH